MCTTDIIIHNVLATNPVSVAWIKSSFLSNQSIQIIYSSITTHCVYLRHSHLQGEKNKETKKSIYQCTSLAHFHLWLHPLTHLIIWAVGGDLTNKKFPNRIFLANIHTTLNQNNGYQQFTVYMTKFPPLASRWGSKTHPVTFCQTHPHFQHIVYIYTPIKLQCSVQLNYFSSLLVPHHPFLNRPHLQISTLQPPRAPGGPWYPHQPETRSQTKIALI